MINADTPAPLAVTMGDPAGIGPEIVVRTLSDPSARRRCVVVGDPLVMRHAATLVGTSGELRVIDRIEDFAADNDALHVLASSTADSLSPPGVAAAAAGRAAFQAIIKAVELAKTRRVGGIVTAPINKEALALAGVPYPGHTELLADYGGAERVAMMLANDELRVVLVSVHCSLQEAIERADLAAQTAAIRFAHQGGQMLGITHPRVAVAGLNPHAGEAGLFGREEIEVIAPAVEAARREGIDASGPWPGDTVFMQARRGRFDVVVAQYHDQGLIPVKYLGLEHGVNITLGLPFVRTSPDHGTAFDIAGRGIADPTSLRTALTYAERLVLHRADIYQNSPALKPRAT